MGLKLPKDWNQVTVEQFQECYFLLGKTPTIDTWIMVLSTLSGKSGNEIEELSITDLKKYIKKLDFLTNPTINENVKKYIAIKGRMFKAVYQASDMQTNQVADLKGLMNSEGQSINDTVVENAHKLLACIYVPLTLKGFKYTPSKHKEVSDYFRKAKMGEVYGTLFFYSKVYKALTETINSYGQKNLEIVKEHMKEIEDWQTRKKTLERDGVGK